tara:strand:+ start:743 stop:2593 length:1851 start_codon:yes stop_codon:yes gene_type:complete
MAPKVKKIKTENVNKFSKIDFDERKEALLQINKGLRDQIKYGKELNKLKQDADKFNERETDLIKDVLDKTKDVFKNRKNLAEETLNSVDLHKLERQMIAEGLEDHIEIVQKLKQENNIQKQINREVNAQVKMYSKIGSSIDSMVRNIPGGGFIGDMLGTDNLGKEMGEEMRTFFAENLQQGMVEGATSGMVESSMTGGFGKSLKDAFSGKGAAVGTLVALTGLIRLGFKQGLESLTIQNTVKKTIFGGAFEGLKDAFGNMGQANLGTLLRMSMNKFRFGVGPEDQAKILAAQVNISGASKETALNIQSAIAKSASMRGVLPADVFKDIANNTEAFATYAKDGGQNIGEAAIRARELGISLDTVFKISDGLLDFQSSIEGELKASLLIGRQLNLNEARRLAMAGDQAGLQEEILRQIGSEEELQRMNAIQRKSLAGALGITVSELNKLASGDLEVKNSDMKQNTDAMKFLTQALLATAGFKALKLGRSFLPALNTAAAGATVATGTGAHAFRLTDGSGKILKNTGAYKTAENAMAAASRKGITLGAGSRLAMGASGIIRFLGPIGFAASFIPLMFPLLKNLVGTNDDISSNTKKSITGANFISTGIHDRKNDMVVGS